MSEEFHSPGRDPIEERRLARERRRRARTIRRIIVFSVELVLLLIVIACGILLKFFDSMNIYEFDPDSAYVNPTGTTAPEDQPQTPQVSTGDHGETYYVSLPSTEESSTADSGSEWENPFSGEGYTTIVVFGMDGRADVGSYALGSNSDVIILVSINNKTGEIRMASIYRDTIMKMYAEQEYKKANYAICNYGVQEAINTLNMNLDLRIDDYVCISWAAAVEAINALGGVDITLKDEFFEIYSTDQQTMVPYLNGLISEIVANTGIDSMAIPREYFSGVWHADGVQAVAYMRLRYTDSDFNRTERQREIIGKMMEKAKAASFNQLYRAWNGINMNMALSLTPNDILGMLGNIMKFSITKTTGYPFTLYDGADYPKESGLMWTIFPVNSVQNVKDLHAFLYNDEDYEPTPMIYQIDEELREIGNFDENWEPLFDTMYYNK